MTPEERKERDREYRRKYRQENRDRLNERERLRRLANLDKYREMNKRSFEANKEVCQARMKKYNKAKWEDMKANDPEAYEARLARMREYAIEYRAKKQAEKEKQDS